MKVGLFAIPLILIGVTQTGLAVMWIYDFRPRL